MTGADGVRWGGLTPANDPSQLLIDWPDFRNDPVAGYDPDFKESVLVDADDDGVGERVRAFGSAATLTKLTSRGVHFVAVRVRRPLALPSRHSETK